MTNSIKTTTRSWRTAYAVAFAAASLSAADKTPLTLDDFFNYVNGNWIEVDGAHHRSAF